jgi:hypothetical protein
VVATFITYLHELVHAIIIGVPSYLIIHGTIKLGKWTVYGNERSKAIWLHYQYRARGQGHQAARVENCQQGFCALIGR